MKLSLPRTPCTEEEIEALNKISVMVQGISKSFQRVGVLQINPVVGLLETLEMSVSEIGFMLQARELNEYTLLQQKIFGAMRSITEFLLKRKSIAQEAPTTTYTPPQSFELKSSVHALGRFGGTRISSERINTENTKQIEVHQQELLQEVIKQQKKLDVQVILKRYDPKIKIQLSKGTDTNLDAREKIRNFNQSTDEHELLFNEMMSGHQENIKELEKAIGSKTDFLTKQYSGVVDYIKSISKLLTKRTIEFEGVFTEAQKQFVDSLDDNLDEFVKYVQTSYKDVQMETYKMIMKYLHHKQEQDRIRYAKQESFQHHPSDTPHAGKHKKISQKTSLHNNTNAKGTEKVAKELIEKSSELTQKQQEIQDLAKKLNMLKENSQHSEKEVEQMRLQQLKLEHDRQKLQYELSKLEKQLVSQHFRPTNDQQTQTDQGESNIGSYLQNQTTEWKLNENESPSVDKSKLLLRENSKSSDGKYNLLDIQRGTEDNILQNELVDSPERKTTSSKAVVSRMNENKKKVPQLSIDNTIRNRVDLSESAIYNQTYSQFSQNSATGERRLKKGNEGRDEFPELSGEASKRPKKLKDDSLQSSIYGQSPDDLVLQYNQSQVVESHSKNKRPSLQLEKSQKLDNTNELNRKSTKSTGGRRVTSRYDGRKKDISERIDEEESSPLRQRPYDTTRSTAMFLNSPVNSMKNQTLDNRFDISAQGQNRKNLKTQFLGTQQATQQDSQFDTARKQFQMEDESTQTEDFLLMEKFLQFLQQIELSEEQKDKVLNLMKKQQEFIPYKLQNEFSAGKLSTTAFISPKSQDMQDKLTVGQSTPQPPVPLFFKSRQYRSNEKLDGVEKPHFKIEALRPEDIVMETMNTALEGEDLDDIDGYISKHNGGVPLTAISDKEITQSQTVKKLYNQFILRQNNKSVAELKNIILRYHKKNDNDQVTEKMFSEFYQKMIVVHKRCGEGCPHLRRFFMRLGFIHARFLNRKILRPFKSVVTPF